MPEEHPASATAEELHASCASGSDGSDAWSSTQRERISKWPVKWKTVISVCHRGNAQPVTARDQDWEEGTARDSARTRHSLKKVQNAVSQPEPSLRAPAPIRPPLAASVHPPSSGSRPGSGRTATGTQRRASRDMGTHGTSPTSVSGTQHLPGQQSCNVLQNTAGCAAEEGQGGGHLGGHGAPRGYGPRSAVGANGRRAGGPSGSREAFYFKMPGSAAICTGRRGSSERGDSDWGRREGAAQML